MIPSLIFIIRSSVMHQVYIDPIFVKGNILRTYILWDSHTRIELKVEFLNRKLITMDRFKIINFVVELMRRSDIDVVMTKQQFINMNFKEFPGLDIKLKIVDF